ncbi:4-methyl-5(B-hydroxyethyl)-thiazole monophosphate biosynthesis protein [Lacticaseibacillus rhamnosus MTCC 5462]|nr:4-methyl-5(B-hydroxyethyl)-thiazole monophosphate biosynthesis protein [Lacticaseibacillus rhamnosus MTCC 5462]
MKSCHRWVVFNSIDYQIDKQLPKIDLLVLIGGNAWSTENEKLRSLIASRLNIISRLLRSVVPSIIWLETDY